jgi:hypothetical protein
MAATDARPGPVRRIVDPLTEFLNEEDAGGIALAIATVVALMWGQRGPGQLHVGVAARAERRDG